MKLDKAQRRITFCMANALVLAIVFFARKALKSTSPSEAVKGNIIENFFSFGSKPERQLKSQKKKKGKMNMGMAKNKDSSSNKGKGSSPDSTIVECTPLPTMDSIAMAANKGKGRKGRMRKKKMRRTTSIISAVTSTDQPPSPRELKRLHEDLFVQSKGSKSNSISKGIQGSKGSKGSTPSPSFFCPETPSPTVAPTAPEPTGSPTLDCSTCRRGCIFVTGFSLVDTSINGFTNYEASKLQSIQDGDVLDLSDLRAQYGADKEFTIVCETQPYEFSSRPFQVMGTGMRDNYASSGQHVLGVDNTEEGYFNVENFVPYTLADDDNGVYDATPFDDFIGPWTVSCQAFCETNLGWGPSIDSNGQPNPASEDFRSDEVFISFTVR